MSKRQPGTRHLYLPNTYLARGLTVAQEFQTTKTKFGAAQFALAVDLSGRQTNSVLATLVYDGHVGRHKPGLFS